MSVEVGQVWIDKDPRMKDRAVRVTRIDRPWWVYYAQCNPVTSWQSSKEYRAKLTRFPNAFRLADAR